MAARNAALGLEDSCEDGWGAKDDDWTALSFLVTENYQTARYESSLMDETRRVAFEC